MILSDALPSTKLCVTEGFTKQHNVHMLVYYEHTSDIHSAIAKEKLIKKWRRPIKMEAIECMNPDWNDLYYELIGTAGPRDEHGVTRAEGTLA